MRVRLMILFSLVLIWLPSLTSAGKPGDVVLDLRSLTESAWVDTTVMLELVLQGRAVERVIAATPGLQIPAEQKRLFPLEPTRFVMRFDVVPKKVGELVLGPYSLTFDGKKLRSNRLVLKVQKAPVVPSALQLTVEPATIDLGKTFRLKLTANDKRSHLAKLKPSKRYAIKSQSTSMDYSFSSGRKREQHGRSYKIEALKPGKLVLGRADLEDLASDIKVDEVTVQVR